MYWGTKNISFATLNICAIPLVTKSIKSRFNRFVSAIDSFPNTHGERPLIISLQEFYATGPLKMLNFLLNGYHMALSGVRGLFFHRAGLVTLSLLPIIRSQYVPFENQGSGWFQLSDKFAGKGFLVTETSQFIHINVHLTADYSDLHEIKNGKQNLQTQRSQVRQLLSYIKNINSDKTVILTGDMNFTPDSDLYNEIICFFEDISSGVPDTWALKRNQHRIASTQFTDVPSAKLDYIFHTKGHRIADGFTSKLFDDENSYISDHSMLIASSH
jgi:endonuclease/exonuclease/phosphatase (EEP) superfamily protein YafD